MGGYVKRCLGLNIYFKVENPTGNRMQNIFIDNKEIQLNQYYTAAFVTTQGIPEKWT